MKTPPVAVAARFNVPDGAHGFNRGFTGPAKAQKHTMRNKTTVARLFFEHDGIHICDDSSEYLDARGYAYQSKAEALRQAHLDGYAHAVGSGTSWDGIKRIPARYRQHTPTPGCPEPCPRDQDYSAFLAFHNID